MPLGVRLRSSDALKNDAMPVQIHRPASYTYLPLSADLDGEVSGGAIKRTFSENVLATIDGTEQRVPHPHIDPSTVQTQADSTVGISVDRRKSPRPAAKPNITISKFAIAAKAGDDDTAYESRGLAKPRNSHREAMSHSVTRSLSGFAPKSWMSASRSPSPSARNGRNVTQDEGTSTVQQSKPHSTPPRSLQTDGKVDKDGALESAGSPSRNGSVMSKRNRRPLSTFLQKSPGEPELVRRPSFSSLRKSLSSDKLPSLSSSAFSSAERVPPMPRSMSTERSQTMGLDTPRKKDELWTAFRTLDSDFQKFKSKSSALKANIVRASLLPFLRAHAHHPSNKTLRAEDLDRRINILNKWWTGLLELLNGRNHQSISGTDRPILLEGMAGIMVRPEWRLPPSPFASASDRSQHVPMKSRSTTSLESSGSDFLAESIHHNVRNMLVQNLLAQMAFVVDKMSLRNAPASLVSFCGKAAAYAFFFCPGVADILVRLWATPTDKVRRVLEEYGIGRNTDLGSTPDAIVSEFPPCLHSLAFKSFHALKQKLRKRPPLPLGAASIQWHGYWVGRWCGRDSDLFFVFTKYYHFLLSEFLPGEAGSRERVYAPGLVLVHAQILTLLDSTIHRQSGPVQSDVTNAPSSATFDDVLTGADATAAALPLPPASITRTMAENRLVILLRDFLSDSSSDLHSSRKLFAEAFSDLLRAAARRTSLFDHNACFTLCDFMEEAIAILARYHQLTESPTSLIDWPFWLEVCKQMVASQNSMTKIRLFAFLYGVWNIITADEQRKRDLCLGWLLSEDCFVEHFNHWCPMVRSYFTRLLCWRLARYDGQASEVDLEIYETFLLQLDSTFAYFLYLEGHNKAENKLPPSTAPCSPAPGRRLLIIRTDSPLSPGGILLSLEGVVPASSSIQSTAYERHSSFDSFSFFDQNSPIEKDSSEESDSPPSASKRRWGLLKHIIPFGSPGTDRTRQKDNVSRPIHDASTPSPQSPTRPDVAAKDNISSDSRQTDPSSSNHAPDGAMHAPPSHRNFSFKFSLEWMERPHHVPKDRRLQHPRLPMPAQMYLQPTRPEPTEIKPRKPVGIALHHSQYAGRALAEWTLTVIECQSFFERRKNEGVPGNKWVETPTLGVESFRKVG